MDDCLPLESFSVAALRSLLTQERARRQELEQEVARLQAGLARQNETIIRLEHENTELRRQVQELRSMVAALTEQNTLLRQQVAALQQENERLRGIEHTPKHEASPWPSERTKQEKEKKPRKTRDRRHNRGRHRMSQVDERVRHVLDACPRCGTHLAGGWVHRRIQVIELPAPARARVIEHQLIARHCPQCRRRVLPSPPGLAAGRVGRCRFGPRLLATVATMAAVERLPGRQIQERLAREYDLHLSHGGIVGLLRLVAVQGQPAYAALQEGIRASPCVHADETGWREDGVPGYIWIFSTPRICYFHYEHSRAGTVADGVLGADFGGILISDFYGVYDHFLGLKQRCWAHLWRDIDKLETEYPTDTALAAWVTGIKTIYEAATALRPPSEQGMTPQAVRAREERAHRYEQQILLLCPETMAEDRPEATLAKRLRRYLQELFTFVREPAVPPTNNAAERSLRPLVIARKISGGTRSGTGSSTRMILASLAATARLQGTNPTQAYLQALLPSPDSSTNSHTL